MTTPYPSPYGNCLDNEKEEVFEAAFDRFYRELTEPKEVEEFYPEDQEPPF